MSALQALQDYASSSDENDEDNTGTASQKDDNQLLKPDVKSQALPSLPPEILGMFEDSATSQHSDPSMHHEGRVRSFEHVEGNWATYVYIPVDLTENLQEVMEDLLHSLPSSVNMKPVPDLHMSISRTVALQYQWIEPFVDSLRQCLAAAGSFTYCFQSVELYANDQKTRSFIGLKVGLGHEEMVELVKMIDACLEEFSLPTYYENPSFHVSFAWCLGDYSQVIDDRTVSAIKERFVSLCGRGLLPVTVSDVWCKSGCKLFRVPLTSHVCKKKVARCMAHRVHFTLQDVPVHGDFIVSFASAVLTGVKVHVTMGAFV